MRAGRKSSAPEERKEISFTVRLSREEYKYLEARSDFIGVTPSVFIRMLLARGKLDMANEPERKPIQREPQAKSA